MTEQAPPPTRPRPRRPRPIVVAATALASFLAVLTLLAAQLHAGQDPALRGTHVAMVAGSGGKRIVTRTSGGAVVTKSVPSAHAGHHPITTRTSGGGGGEHDD